MWRERLHAVLRELRPGTPGLTTRAGLRADGTARGRRGHKLFIGERKSSDRPNDELRATAPLRNRPLQKLGSCCGHAIHGEHPFLDIDPFDRQGLVYIKTSECRKSLFHRRVCCKKSTDSLSDTSLSFSSCRVCDKEVRCCVTLMLHWNTSA